MYITGDMNARVGTISNSNHRTNPGVVINPNGKNLIDILNVVLNGLNNRKFESKYTFFRGNARSQVDLAITNRPNEITPYKILNKLIYSDHCPMTFSSLLKPSLHFIGECSRITFSYDHYATNKRIKIPLNITRIEIPKATSSLKELAQQIKNSTWQY